MHYYEVLIADSAYHSDKPLTYSSESELTFHSTVTVPLRSKSVTGFVNKKVAKPAFAVQPVKNIISLIPLPQHCLDIAGWLSTYYSCPLGDSLRLIAPAGRGISRLDSPPLKAVQTELSNSLTSEQSAAVKKIYRLNSTTTLLHGETGSGKTRVYLELAAYALESGQSVIMLTPEVSLTAQLSAAVKSFLGRPVFILHSQLGTAARKKMWLEIIGSKEPVIIVGARSALFAPVQNLGLIVVDEAHEPAYKQDQSPRYQTARVASQLGKLSGARVVLGSATPELTDYYLAELKKSVVRMAKPAISGATPPKVEIIDLRDRTNFGSSNHLSLKLIDEIKTTLSAKKQILIYLNRRGSARLILCNNCGWEMQCPNCDIPLVYHGDDHKVRCHTCGYQTAPPIKCPKCANTEIIYRSAGTKSLTEELIRLFPEAKVRRFDSDNKKGERLEEQYDQIKAGKIDILVGTQLLAKGLDLPRLGLVGVVAAESSMGLPDFSAEERSFQLLYQIIGRVGRGHGSGKVIIQSYQPDNPLVLAAAKRDYQRFYRQALKERQTYGFPPFCYLAQLICKRASAASSHSAAEELIKKLAGKQLSVQILGPATPFYARRGNAHYAQLILKSKNRKLLQEITQNLPSGWQINLDPINLL